MEELSIENRRSRIERFDFRSVHPRARFGTASDRYAGWIGQIYPESYAAEVSSRTRRLGGKTFEERTVPVESVSHYFEHFGVLEIDFTYYRPLRDADGEETSNYRLLQRYALHAPPEARFYLKVPRTYFSRILRRGRGTNTDYAENPEFLNVGAYVQEFHAPAVEILGDRLAGMLFEQQYQRQSESPSAQENVAELDAFFSEVPSSVQPHIELRSEHLLAAPYFAWLEDSGIGFVFSHWTWLPPIRKQWRLAGERFTAADGNAVVRLLTPISTRYADAYAMAHPFDQPVDEISGTRQGRDMVMDTTALLYQAEKHSVLLSLIVSNRAWGNAPILAQEIANRILDYE
jgi:uncharacterized protein YecE (DUF72 family)